MHLSTVLPTLTPLFLAARVNARQADGNNCSLPNDSIRWEPCVINGDQPADCGKLLVPLDYSNVTAQDKIDISIVRIPAPIQPSKAGIYLNFGGPGAAGITEFAEFLPRLQAATGNNHDLINVIPRGTNDTITFSCYEDPVSRRFGTEPIAGNASDVATGALWARASLLAQNCGMTQNETGRFVGTVSSATDTVRVAELLEEDQMLRFWGMSYGTLLGETLAALFPEKIDKMLLDGVVNPFDYYQNIEVSFMASIDDTFRGFCTGCVNAPQECPLARNNTAEQLEQSVFDFLDRLKENPIPLADPSVVGGGILIDYSFAKTYILSQLNFPRLWPDMADMLDMIMTLQLTGAVPPDAGDLIEGILSLTQMAGSGGDESQFGIKCGDVIRGNQPLEEVVPIFEARQELSYFGDSADQVLAYCAQWQLPAQPVFDGVFSSEGIRNPILIVNNRFDPATSLINARNVSETFEGSVLLEQNSYGHTSLVQGSLCTALAIRAYFASGELPPAGTVCEGAVPLFSGSDGWPEVIQMLASNATLP
ncbi:proteinase [Stachybotrys elegans]|uniref:Proteinase n=1 Tax=Stachybotrys elegans TaxID=80388 RepID=A0A8K0STY0_9HYPO|nr:proteinase [Stachybotrys elegans]